jgi:AraC-like DNA-binding protein
MASTISDFTSFHFSTEGLPPMQRPLIWHEVFVWDEVFGRAISRRQLYPLSDEPFRVNMTVRRLANPTVASDIYSGVCVERVIFTVGFRVQRTPGLLTDGNDDVILQVHETGRRIVSQLRREATAESGGGVVSSNAHTSTIVLPEPCCFTTIGVPRKLMLALVPGLEDALVRPLPPDARVLRLLMGYLGILDDDHALQTPELQGAVTAHIHDLFALALGATRDAAEIAAGRGLRAARLHAIKTDIAQNLAGDVSVSALSMRHGVSTRYIRKLFEGENTSLSRFVLGQRLTRVHRMLSDPRYADRTISDIAFTIGFGDLSTFNREFRRRFRMTPSDVRWSTQARH